MGNPWNPGLPAFAGTGSPTSAANHVLRFLSTFVDRSWPSPHAQLRPRDPDTPDLTYLACQMRRRCQEIVLRVEFFDHGLIDWWLVALVEGVQWILPVETGLPDRQGGRKMKRFGPVGQGGMRQMKQ